ncbi:MAG: hypothetical protein ACYDCO_05580 [Armatimonadota bacterium]
MSREVTTPAAVTADSAWVESLTIRTIDPDRVGDVAIASLPLPQHGHAAVAFAGMATQAVPIAWYANAQGADPGLPRQLLIMGIAEGSAPDALGLVRTAPVAMEKELAAPSTPDPTWTGPHWQTIVIEEKKTGVMMREVNELAIEHLGRRLGIRLGIVLADGGYHWWEWLQVEQLWTGPVCTAIRAAGYVHVTSLSEDDIFDPTHYNAGEWLHKHNWIFAEVYIQLFTNGLARVTARHVNNRFFDEGRDLEGFVPVIAFNTGGAAQYDTLLDGAAVDFALGDVQLDLDRAADLISPAHPGRLYSDAGLTIYQPYEGVEADIGDGTPIDRWKVEASERRMWKGMARSVGFDLSFADRPLRTRRYLPPYGWLGYAGVLWPDGLLPARGPLESNCDDQLRLAEKAPSMGSKPFCSGRYFQGSVGIDGEQAFGWMQQAYRTARRDLYEAALHHAYAFADVGIDHADFTHQIAGMPRGSVSLVLQRNLGILAGYLETGDPYLLRVAEAMANTAYEMDRSNWPRRSFGRDAAYIRSLTRLYDVTGQTFYLQRAGATCRRVAQCQRPEGSFADQGGTYGPHGHLNEIIKPWMSSILAETLMEYLARAGSDPAVEQCLVRNADWLLSVLLEDEDGAYWPYQVAWGRNEFDPTTKWAPGQPQRPHPVGDVQLDFNARTLLWVSLRTGDPRYARAWQATYQRRVCLHARDGKPYSSTYGHVKIADNFPWHETHLWGAHWDGRCVTYAPQLNLLGIGREATIELPTGGSQRVRRTESGIEIIDDL